MCEDRIVRMKRDVRLAKHRARRLRQLTDFIANPSRRVSEPTSDSSDSEDSANMRGDAVQPTESPRKPAAELASPQSNMQQIALRTIHLMRQNVEIQRRVEELKKETTAFVISMMADPENRRRYEVFMAAPTPFQTPPASEAGSSAAGDVTDDARSLPDLDDGDANHSHDVTLRDR